MCKRLVRDHQQSRKPKVRNFNISYNNQRDTLKVNKYILRLEIAMKYFFLVTEINPTQYFLDDSFGLFFLNHVVLRMNKLLKVVLVKIEDDLEVLFDGLVDDIT